MSAGRDSRQELFAPIGPEGQARLFVSGTVESGGELMLIADPDALAGHL